MTRVPALSASSRPLLAAAALLAAAPRARRPAARVPSRRCTLPGDASRVGGPRRPGDLARRRPPGRRRARASRARFGARHIGRPATGGYVVARERARAFAGALRSRGLLVYAQPNALRQHAQAVADDPLSARRTPGAPRSPTRRSRRRR